MKTRILRTTLVLLFVIAAMLLASVLFIQYYPFRKSLFFTQANYPTLTFTSQNKPGDPVNVMIIGNQTAIQEAFLNAGWKVPDPITPKTSAKIALDAVANRPYPTAPVSNLYLFQRKQDMAFEKPTNTARVRDHIRLWRTQTTYRGEAVWLAAATLDNGIEISSTTDLPTHHVAPAVDEERNNVYQALKPSMRFSTVVPFTQPNLIRFNGGGDWYFTDGDIAVLSTANLSPSTFTSPDAGSRVLVDRIFGVVTFFV